MEAAARKIQAEWRRRRKMRLLAEHDFIKYLDTQSGNYYYVKRDDPNYITWSIPHGDVPLWQSEHKVPKRKPLARDKKFHERQIIIKQVRLEHQETKRREEYQRKEKEDHIVRTTWQESFQFALLSGELNVRSRRLGHIHSDLLNPGFEEKNGKALEALRLIDHDLKQLDPQLFADAFGRITKLSSSLQHLNLASNSLETLPNAICELRQLKTLNLLRNQLTTLPARFGDLGRYLEHLQIATNKLERLPVSFGNLTKLDQLVLDCNKLKRIPETLGKLQCTSISVSKNLLVSLPRCFFSGMTNLTTLSANQNHLRQLPNCIGDSRSLTRLTLCTNQIDQLPESLANMTQLQTLWLDHNLPLTTLPWNFFRLISLRELSMNGCVGMCYPTQDKLTLGAACVREWFRRRQKHALFVRRHRVVTAFQDILEQIAQSSPRLVSPAFFEANMEYDHEHWYALACMDNFWNEVMPALRESWEEGLGTQRGRVTSLPYARDDVEKILASYTDAEGPILLHNVSTCFRLCACLDPITGKRKVCIPPKPGWMCQRKATLIKTHVVLQREQIEKERRRRENLAIEQAIEAARFEARELADSEQGKALFLVRAQKLARREMEVRRAKRWEDEKSKRCQAAEARLRFRHNKKRRSLEQQRAQHERTLYKQLHEELEPLEQKLDGYAREKVKAQIDQVIETLSDLPEARKIKEIDAELETALQETEKRIRNDDGYRSAGLVRSWFKSDAKEEKELIRELEIDLVDRYAAKKVRRAEKTVRAEHATMRKIATNWAGMTLLEVFANWRKFSRREKRRRIKDRWSSRATELRTKADAAAAVELALSFLAKFEPDADIWTDERYWRNTETGTKVWEQPLLEHYLPKKMEIPSEFIGVDEESANKRRAVLDDQAKSIIQPVLEKDLDDDNSIVDEEETFENGCRQSRRVGVNFEDNDNTNSEESDDCLSDESNSDNDSSTTDSQTEEAGDISRPQETEVVYNGDDDEDEVLGHEEERPDTSSTESSVDLEALEFKRLDASLPALDDVLKDHSLGALPIEERKEQELQAARQRAQARRRASVQDMRRQNALRSEAEKASAQRSTIIQRVSTLAKAAAEDLSVVAPLPSIHKVGDQQGRRANVYNVSSEIGFDSKKQYTAAEMTLMAKNAYVLEKSKHAATSGMNSIRGALEKSSILKKGWQRITSPNATARRAEDTSSSSAHTLSTSSSSYQ